MPTQNVNITDAQAEFIRLSVESGDYNNASELVREALRLLKEQKDEHQARIAYLRGELQEGLDDLEAGPYTELNTEDDFDALRKEIRKRRLEKLDRIRAELNSETEARLERS